MIFIACLSMTNGVFAQETIEEKRELADEYFKKKNWLEAEKLYASVIANAPRDHDLNFRYGVCLIYGSKKKEEAIKRLRFAVTGGGVDPKAFYYLGKAYHLNYQFNDAIKQYNKFKQVGSSGELKKLNVETDLKACNHGKKLLSNVTDMIVLQKSELGADRFYDLYKLNDIGGTILVTDEFQTKFDKKAEHRPVIHFPSNSPTIFYSSYGENGATGLDIYVKKKLPGGGWSLSQKVKGAVNTFQDEDYAYMHPNGRYLYFCSKGHNSMGGYDVFRSKYNPSDDSFGPPENLDFAISSPDDDLLFVVDSLDKTAYFSSARSSGEGKLTVYKVRVDRIPMQIAVIKGNFLNTIDGGQKEVEIEVEDFSSGRLIGKFNSKKTNGDYLITFPKSGKYNFVITPKGSDISHLYTVDIPYIKEFRPLKQQMTLSKEGLDDEEVIVADLFTETFDDPVGILAEVYRELSQLPPNSTQFNLDSLDEVKADNDIFAEVGLDPFATKEGIEDVVKSEVEDIQESIDEDQTQANIAYNVAAEKSNEANQKMVELNELLAQTETISDPVEKNRLLEQVRTKKKEIETLNNESQNLIELADEIETSIEKKKQTIEEGENVLANLSKVEDEDRSSLSATIKANQVFFTENVLGNPEVDNVVTRSLENGASEQQRIQDLSEEISKLSDSKNELIRKNKNLNKRLETEKKKKVIASIQAEIDENDSEIAVLEESIESKSKSLDKVLNDDVAVKNGLAAAIVLSDENNTPKYTKELTPAEKQEIISTIQTNDLTESLASVNSVLDDNNVSAFNIDLFGTSEETENYSLPQWNDAIDDRAEKLKAERLKASEERKKEIEAELERLEKLREEKAKEFEVVTNDEDPKNIRPEINQDDIVPNYSGRQESIGEIVNEKDRRKASLELNYELADEIATERKKLEQILEDDPKNKNVKERLKNLDIVEKEINDKIEEDKEWVLVNGDDNTFDPNEALSNLAPDYQKKVNEAYEIVDEQERNKAINDLNGVILEKSNERIQELNAIVANDPANKKAKDELAYLEDLVRNVEENRDQVLVEPEEVNLDELSAKVEVSDLVKDFARRKKVIDGITDEYKRKQEENKLFQDVVGSAKKEVSRLDRLAENNQGNKIIPKRKKSVNEIDDFYTSSIKENKEWLANNPRETTDYADRKNVRNAYPPYQEEINRIAQIDEVVEREAAVEKLNEETVEQINERIKTLDQELIVNSENTFAQKEKDELEVLRERLITRPKDPLIAVTSADKIIETYGPNDIVANYDARLNDINTNTAYSEEDKQLERLKLNERLVETVESELASLDQLETLYPEKTEAIEAGRNSLNDIKSTKFDEIKEDRTKLQSNLAENRQPVSIEALMPYYKSDLATIDASSNSEKEKLQAKNRLYSTLISTIDAKVNSLEKEQLKNPELQSIIEEETAQFNAIKTEREQEIAINSNLISNIENSENGAVRPTISIENLMPSYPGKYTLINASGDSDDKIQADKNELNKVLISVIDTKIESLKREQSSNPDLNGIIGIELSELNAIKTKKEAEIIENGGALATTDETDNTTEESSGRTAISIDGLLPGYSEEIAQIDASEDPEIKQLTDKNRLNDLLIGASNARISSLKNERNNNPSLGRVITSEIEQIESIINAKQLEFEANNTRIAELSDTANNTTENPTTSRPSITIESLMPEYNGRLSLIEASTDSEKIRLEEKNQLNTTLINAINSKIESLKFEQSNSLELKEIIDDEITGLETLRFAKEKEIEANNQRLTELTPDIVDTNPTENTNRPSITIGSLIPSYENDLANVEQLTSDEKQRLIDKNKLHNALINAINSKISSLETEREGSPELNAIIGQEIEELNEIKRSKEAEIATNQTRIDTLNESDTTDNTRPTVSTSNLLPSYDSGITDIRNGSGTDIEKMEAENALNQELIDQIDKRIAEVESETGGNAETVQQRDSDIAKLQDLKRSTLNSIQINKDQINQLKGGDLNRPAITIESLVPGFEEKMAEIENSKAPEKLKLTEKNKLNQQLIQAIQNRVDIVQEEWEEDPVNGFVYNEEIDKLEELQESKRSEVSKNNELLKEIEGNTVEVAEIKADDFSSQQGKSIINEFNDELVEIKGIDTELTELNDELRNAENDKKKAKIQKQIDKLTEDKAEIENEIIEELSTVNESEINQSRQALKLDQDIAKSSSGDLEEEINEANENLIRAEQKFKQAKQLRSENETIKDPIQANEKLQEALNLENEAKELIEQSKRTFKLAKTADTYATEETIITEVSENPSERKSTELENKAADLRNSANDYFDRANELRDSAETVKQKYKTAIIAKADETDKKGNELQRRATDLEDEAKEIKTQENEILAASIEPVNKTVNQDEQNEISSSETYKNYLNEKNQGDEKLEEAKEIETQIEELKQRRTRRFKNAVKANVENPETAIAQDNEVSKTQEEIDSLTAIQKELRDEALKNYANAKALISNANTEEQESIIALAQNGVAPTEKQPVENADYDVPNALNTNLFRTTDASIYSNDTPIPISERQPSGLVYKIQVGAFRKALPQDHFTEFAPISGEKLNNGITRYMVGYFTKFDSANTARTQVNQIGYGDAFVVAYCNGERITVDRAKLIEEGLIKCEPNEVVPEDNLTIDNTTENNQPDNTDTQDNNTNTDTEVNNTTENNTTDSNNKQENQENNTTENVETTTNNTLNPNVTGDQSNTINVVATTPEEQQLVAYYQDQPNAAKANQVEIIKGLFYTVQIGVYSKPVANSALFNIQPLNSQRTESGFIRYSTGIFTSEEAATVRKDEVVQIGVTDAFVTAYFDGERITLERALEILVEKGADAFAANQNNDSQETGNNTTTETNEVFFKEGLFYRILIGKYENAIPGEYATILLQGDNVFETEVDQEGRTCLLSSKLETYENVENRVKEFADLGIEDMDIVTYYKYDVIPFNEGEKIRNDQEIDNLNPYDEIKGISADGWIYNKEAIYFKIKLGEFEDNVPADFTNLLLLYEAEEKINKEETIDDEILFFTNSIPTFTEAETTRKRLLDKGFSRAIIIAYHKYDEISIGKAKEILGE